MLFPIGVCTGLIAFVQELLVEALTFFRQSVYEFFR